METELFIVMELVWRLKASRGKNMKKLIMLVIFLIAISGVNAATTVQTNWNGGGNFDTHFTAGDDAVSAFRTGGNLISGEWYATDSDNNPYSYGIDSVTTGVRADVTNGFIEYQFDRTDSKSSYGPAGEQSYTSIYTDGTGDFAWRSSSNYASLASTNYGWEGSRGQIQATGLHTIIHTFTANPKEWAGIFVSADANTYITDMGESSNGNSYTFGSGNGCYTAAEVDIDGSGMFDLTAYADNSIVTEATGITTDGLLNIHANFVNGFHFDNFALTGN